MIKKENLHHLPDSLRGSLHGVLGAFELLLHSDLPSAQKDIAQLGRKAAQELVENLSKLYTREDEYSSSPTQPTSHQAPPDKHILLVEDNPINQQSVSKFLRKAGFEVTIANNGVEAIQLANSQRFDLILMDIHMPILSGKEAMVTIRETHPNIPIVAMTANCSPKDQSELSQLGASGFLLKPFGRELLLDTALLYCSRSSQDVL